METRAKDAAAATVKKDKKPIVSSQAQRQGNPKPGASQLGSNDKVKSAAAAAATSPAKKPTPNYLRPTLGSKPESPTRKSTTSASDEDKARLIRRRSLDRPSSLSRQDSAGTNKEAAEASRLRTSSSLKSMGNSSNRVASSVHKPGGSRSVNPALKSQVPLRRRSSLSSPYKNGISSAHVPSTSSSPTKANKAGLGSDPDNKLVETTGEGLVCSDAEVEQVHSDELEASDKEHLESEAVDTDAKPSGSEDQNSPQEVVVEEAENLPANENNQAEDSSPDEVRVSDQDKGEENVIDGQDLTASEQPAAEEVKHEEEGACDEKTNGDEVEEEGGQKEVTDQVAKEAAVPQQPASVQKRVVVQGKKESPSAYNDVIEETKNKLLEARKNKVKALVGAFETVIDYESGSK